MFHLHSLLFSTDLLYFLYFPIQWHSNNLSNFQFSAAVKFFCAFKTKGLKISLAFADSKSGGAAETF